MAGRRDTYGTGLAPVACLGTVGRAVTPRHFAWQAWHLATSTLTLRGGCGTWRHPPSFCVADMALHDIHLGLAWQVWHFTTSTVVSRGRRGTWRGTWSHRPSFFVWHDISVWGSCF